MNSHRSVCCFHAIFLSLVASLGVGSLSSDAHAQDAVAPTAAPAPATTVAEKPIAEHAQGITVPPAEFYRETLFVLSGGATLNTGNARSFAANVGSRFSLKRDRHQLTLEAQFIYGIASLRDENDADGDGNLNEFNDYDLNTRRLGGLARYDLFLTQDDAIFAAMAPLWDTFAGLDFRLQNQIGYMRNFFNVEGAHRGWGEIGYDLTYDNWTNGADQTNHSVRAFLGYDNHINEMVTFLTGVEGLFNVERSKDVRVAWSAQLTSKLMDSFQAGVRFALRYDNQPVPGAEKLDTITTMNLMYAMDFEEPVKEEPVADCEAQTAKAVSDAVARCKAVQPVVTPAPPVAEEPAPPPAEDSAAPAATEPDSD